MTTKQRTRSESLQTETDYRLACGQEQLSVEEFGRRFLELGYCLHRMDDCHCTAQYLDSGRTYPCTTTGLLEADTRKRAFNVEARRDARFREMQELRGKIFAVSRGRILEV